MNVHLSGFMHLSKEVLYYQKHEASGPWVISWIPFLAPSESKSLMTCHSSSWNAIVQCNSFWWQLFLYGGTFLIDCFLCLSLLLTDLFDLQFVLWFYLDLMLPKKGHRVCKHVLWEHPSKKGKNNCKECP